MIPSQNQKKKKKKKRKEKNRILRETLFFHKIGQMDPKSAKNCAFFCLLEKYFCHLRKIVRNEIDFLCRKASKFSAS